MKKEIKYQDNSEQAQKIRMALDDLEGSWLEFHHGFNNLMKSEGSYCQKYGMDDIRDVLVFMYEAYLTDNTFREHADNCKCDDCFSDSKAAEIFRRLSRS